ncbi:hypothetical protein A2U01_0061562, partial [Trifolium medium]|nr:hypothetical protein [Trifolium medium]
MEEFKYYDTRKRVRDDSDLDSPDSKRVHRVDSDSIDNSSESHLSRVNSTGSCADSFGSEHVSVEPDS